MSSESSIGGDMAYTNQNSTENGNFMFWCTVSLSFISTVFLLMRFHNPLQFYVKLFVYAFLVMFYSTILIPYSMLRPRNPKNIELAAKIMRFTLTRIFSLKFTVENTKYFQINQPYIVICNHQSALDVLTMMVAWPGGNCTPLAKKELLYAGPLGLIFWLNGITFIDRLNPDKAKGTIEKLAQKINEKNLRVWIFPEGTRSAKTEMLPFKKGSFHLAIQAQVPIVCAVTSSYLNFFSVEEKKFLQNGEIKVRILPPFQTKGMSLQSVNQLTKHLQEKMQNEYDLLNQEINLDKKYYKQESTTNLVTDLQTSECSAVHDLSMSDLTDLNETNPDNKSMNLDTSDLKASQIPSDNNNNSINEDEQTDKLNS